MRRRKAVPSLLHRLGDGKVAVQGLRDGVPLDAETVLPRNLDEGCVTADGEDGRVVRNGVVQVRLVGW